MKINTAIILGLIIFCCAPVSFAGCSKKHKPDKPVQRDIASTITRRSLQALQAKLDDLSAKARQGRWKDFTAVDRALLWLGFQSIVAEGRRRGYEGAAVVLDHYLSGEGRELAVDPVYFRKSPVVIRALDEHYRTIALKKDVAKETPLRIDPAEYGWLDTNLRYMMNPFFLHARDSLGDDGIHATYRVACHIKFYQNSRTYFFLAGDTLVFPDNLGVALESLGMGRPFDLTSAWEATRDSKE